MADLKETILSILEKHHGRESAIKGHALLYQVNRIIWPDVIGERKMRNIIEHELPRILFCTTSPGGYFLPSNIGEVNKTVEHLDHYIKGTASRRKAILAAYPDARQGELFGRQP
jgi:hypothetical protein